MPVKDSEQVRRNWHKACSIGYKGHRWTMPRLGQYFNNWAGFPLLIRTVMGRFMLGSQPRIVKLDTRII